MHLSPISTATASYRVEVSGWDSSQSFFVEKADLEWSDSGEKLVVLRHELREDSILFVRLLQPLSPDRSHPVPYAAEPLGLKDYSQWEYRLRQIQPQTSRTQTEATN